MLSSEQKILKSLPARALFDFALPCRYASGVWTRDGAELDETFRLPNLAVLEGPPPPLEVRAAWNEEGLVFSFDVFDPKASPSAARRLHQAEWLNLFIATRPMKDVHRATRHCQRFVLVVNSVRPNEIRVDVAWKSINRAKETPPGPPSGSVGLHLKFYPDGFRIDMMLTADSLVGYDPREYPRLAFNYALYDWARQKEHVLTAGPPLPYDEDPSLWATLELIP